MSFEAHGCDVAPGERTRVVVRGYGFDHPEEKFDVVSCPKCALAWVDPLLNHEELKKYYAPSYYGSFESKFSGPIEALTEISNWIRARELIPHLVAQEVGARQILDVGCGRGNFLKFLARQGFECHGTELEGFEFGPAPKGVTFHHGQFEQVGLPKQSLSAVTIWHVLEHLTDPQKALTSAYQLLKPGGVLAIAVPNFGCIQRKLFGKHWFHLDLPRHLFHFSRQQLFGMLHSAGFSITRSHTQSWSQNTFGFIQSFLNQVLRWRPPNELYQLLKTGRRTVKNQLLLGAYLPAVIVLVPIAVFENLVATLLGRGGTLVVYARRPKESL